MELVPVPAIIIACLVVGVWKRSYLSQMFVIANVIIFIYQYALFRTDIPLSEIVHDAQTFVPARIGQIEYLPSILTSMFMHAGTLHLIGNVLILYLLGLPLEERVGTRNFAVIYFMTGIAATISFFLFHTNSDAHLLGASGAIFGIGGALLVLYPRDEIPMVLGFIFLHRIPVWIAVGAMALVESLLVFYSNMDNVAHVAHIGGLICGIIIAPMIVKDRKKAKTKLDFAVLRTLAPTEEDLAIMDKIEKETEEDVREAWLDFYFTNVARCPKCKRHVTRADTIECECGQTIKITK